MLRAGKPIGDPQGRITAQAAAQVVERAGQGAELPGDWSGAFAAPRLRDRRTAGRARPDLHRPARRLEGRQQGLLGYFEDVDKWEENPLSGTGL